MTFDRTIYFDGVRDRMFGGALTQQQVDGQNVILAVWEHQQQSSDLRWLAYMLATAYHETAKTMWPIEEYGGESYLQGKDYYPYYGRGLVQLTWEENYARATERLDLGDSRDLVAHPDLALDLLIATRVMFRGMEEGWFTGAALPEFFSMTMDDPVEARTIINGHDCDEQIAGYHHEFLEVLLQAEVKPQPSPPPAAQHVYIDIVPSDGVEVTVELNGKLLGEPPK